MSTHIPHGTLLGETLDAPRAVALHEPAVTLTDYGLALECALFAVLLRRCSTPSASGSVRSAFVLFFVAGAVAPGLGGTVHGFLPDPTTLAHRLAWAGTLLAIGVSAMAAAVVALRLELSPARAGRLTPLVVLAFVAYAIVVVFVRQDFVVAIGAYLPAAVLLAIALLRRRLAGKPGGTAAGIRGLLLTFVAAVFQQAQWGLHPVYFDHNAVYHVIQAVALYLLFRCALGIDEAS